LLLPELKSTGSWILPSVRGAKDVLEGRTRALSGIVIRDSYTLDIQLEEPVAFFLSLLTMHGCGIVCPEDARDPEHYRLLGTGAGPFRVAEAVEGDHVKLVRHRDYFIPDMPLLDELTFRLDLRSFREMADAFLRGELDIAHGIPPAIVNQVRDDPQFAPYLQTMVQLHTSYLGWDNSSAPFDRVEVRQAVNHAIDRQRINDRVYSGLAVVAQSLLPPGLLGYDESLRGPAYDPDRARALMRQAGHSSGFAVEYRTWDTDEFNNSGLVPLIIEDLAAIGIRVNVTRHAATEARAPLDRPGHGQLYCANWWADFPDS